MSMSNSTEIERESKDQLKFVLHRLTTRGGEDLHIIKLILYFFEGLLGCELFQRNLAFSPPIGILCLILTLPEFCIVAWFLTAYLSWNLYFWQQAAKARLGYPYY